MSCFLDYSSVNKNSRKRDPKTDKFVEIRTSLSEWSSKQRTKGLWKLTTSGLRKISHSHTLFAPHIYTVPSALFPQLTLPFSCSVLISRSLSQNLFFLCLLFWLRWSVLEFVTNFMLFLLQYFHYAGMLDCSQLVCDTIDSRGLTS